MPWVSEGQKGKIVSIVSYNNTRSLHDANVTAHRTSKHNCIFTQHQVVNLART